MNEGQIYRAEEIKKAIEEIEVIIGELGLAKKDHYEKIMKNAEIIKHHSVALIFKKDEWE